MGVYSYTEGRLAIYVRLIQGLFAVPATTRL